VKFEWEARPFYAAYPTMHIIITILRRQPTGVPTWLCPSMLRVGIGLANRSDWSKREPI